MPIIVDSQTLSSGNLAIRLQGMPDFNAGNSGFKITDFEGWYSVGTPDAVLVANGGGPGAVATGEWQPSEQYYTLSGFLIAADRSSVEALRRMMLAALPSDADMPIQVLDGMDGLQVFARRYDKPDINPIGPKMLQFTYPLVAPDPFKYGLDLLGGPLGVFAGADWFRTYDVSADPPSRVYSLDAGEWVRTYTQQGDIGVYPTSLGLNSPGDATSRRLTVDVVGPQADGWWVQRQDSSGTLAERLWVDLSLSAGQTVSFDCANRTARLNGADVSHLTFGDFLTLPPGGSTFRLVATDDLGGYASISALPAYL